MDSVILLATNTVKRFDGFERCKFVILAVMLCVTVYLSQWHNPPEMCKIEDVGNKDVDKMSQLDMIKYLYWYDTKRPCHITNDYGGVMGINPKLITGMDGHKKMCMDPGLIPRANNCIIYDFGVGNEWSFDDAVAKLGCQIYAFDPTMDAEDHDHSTSIHFQKMGVSDEDTDKDPNGWKVKTLDSIYRMLKAQHGDVPIDYVKMDIELYEWRVMPQIIESGVLDHVKQLAIQLHLHTGAIIEPYVRSCVKTLRALEASGMVRFGSRVNYYMIGPIMGRYKHTIYELVWYNEKFK